MLKVFNKWLLGSSREDWWWPSMVLLEEIGCWWKFLVLNGEDCSTEFDWDDKVKFWRDRWCGDETLDRAFLNMFWLRVDREASVEDI